MGFGSVSTLVDAYLNGAFNFTHFRKVPSQVSSAGYWFDLSMAAGYPVPNFYANAPYESAVLSARSGIYHGQNVAPLSKHMFRFNMFTAAANAVPSSWILCDYLLYYPFIDLTVSDEQPLVQVATLPRYTSGEGVYAFIVSQQAPGGGGVFSYNYIDSTGSARTTTNISLSGVTSVSALLTSGPATSKSPGPFLRMESGVKGIRSLTSITFTTPSASGLAALVLVKPLLTLTLLDITAATELSVSDRLLTIPKIEDGAVLSLIGMSITGTVSTAVFSGWLETVWN